MLLDMLMMSRAILSDDSIPSSLFFNHGMGQGTCGNRNRDMTGGKVDKAQPLMHVGDACWYCHAHFSLN